MATTTLMANRLRSGLTMLGIIIGNASVISIVGIVQASQRLAESEFESLGPNVLFIIPGSREARNTTFEVPKTLVWSDAQAIANQVKTVQGVAPQINSRQVISYGNQNLDGLVLGVTPEFLTVRSFDVAQGRFINSLDLQRYNRIVVIGAEIADRLFPQSNPIGKQIRIKNISWQVVGVMEAKGSFLGQNQDDTVYLPLTSMANQIVGKDSPYGIQVSLIAASVTDSSQVSAAQFQIENLLRLRHQITGEDDFYVQTQQDLLSIIDRVSQGLTLMLVAVSSVSLLVGGIGVMNIMIVAVSERTHEIGLRKAIGATKADILLQFLLEAVILAALGGAMGTVIGIGTISLLSLFTPLEMVISPVVVGITLTVSSSIGLFFGVLPAQKAANLDPIAALRSA